MLRLAFLCATGPLISMITLVYSMTIFDKIKIDKGSDEYAEQPWPSLPWYCAMPLNTLVNIVYTIVGFCWLIRRCQQRSNDIYSYVFPWMAIIYSGIQFFRIATQQHIFGVLDQWYTLHMASWVFIWALSLQVNDNTWSLQKTLLIDSFSYLSYPIFALIHSQGFEMALVIHLILIFSAIIRLHLTLQEKNNASFRLYLICVGTLCCTGFVAFDLLELYLASLWPFVFTVCSGHFLSRMCDAMQIHFVLALFTMIEDYKRKGSVVKKMK